MAKSVKGPKAPRLITDADLQRDPEFKDLGLEVGDLYPGEEAQEDNSPAAEPTAAPPIEGKGSAASPYSLYEKRRIEVTPIRSNNNIVGYTFEIGKRLREAPYKLAPYEVETLNSQSHNSLERFYPNGSITNGDTEDVRY